MITDERLQGFQTTVGSLLGKAASLANAPLGATAALGFAVETVFRLIRLGCAIRRAQLEADKRLNEAVRLQDIPREAIPLDLTDLVVAGRIRSGEFEAQFPEAAAQFRHEIEQFRSRPLWAVPRRTRRLLAFAVRHVPALVREGQLEAPELQHLFGRWLHPITPDYRRLIGEMEQLLPSPDLDTDSHLARTAESFQTALQLSRLGLDDLTAAEQEKLTQTISGLVADAVLGPAELADKTLGFLVNLKRTQIDDEIRHCQAELAGIGPGETDAAARKAAITARIENLKAWKARLV